MTISMRDVEADQWWESLTDDERELVARVEATPVAEVTVEDRREFEAIRYGER